MVQTQFSQLKTYAVTERNIIFDWSTLFDRL